MTDKKPTEDKENFIVSSNDRINEKLKGAEPDDMAEALEQMKEADKQKKKEATKKNIEGIVESAKNLGTLPGKVGKAVDDAIKTKAAETEKIKNMTPEEKKQHKEKVDKTQEERGKSLGKQKKDGDRKAIDALKKIFIGNTPDVVTILPYDPETEKEFDYNKDGNYDKYLPEGSEYIKYRGNVGRMKKDLDKNENLTPEERKKKEDELIYYEHLNDWGKTGELGKDYTSAQQEMRDYIDAKKPYWEKAQNVYEDKWGMRYEPASGKGASINNLIGKPTDKDTTETTDKTTTDTKPTTDATEKPDTSNVIGKDVVENVADAKYEQTDKFLKLTGKTRSQMDDEWDEIVRENNDELQRVADASDLSKFLPTFAIAHYLQGDFGKKGTGKALGTLGYFLLDKIGASLTNASLVARGLSPTQETALQKYNDQMMKEAITRDSKTRMKAAEEKINNWVKNKDTLVKAGYDAMTLGNDLASKIVSKGFDNLDEANMIRLKKEEAEYYDKLSDEDKMSMLRIMSALSADPDERSKGILNIQKLELEKKTMTNEADIAKANYEIEKAKTDTALYGKVANKLLEQTSVTVDNLIKQGKLTENEAENVYQAARSAKTDADFRKGKNTLELFSTGTKSLTDVVRAFTGK